MVNVRKAYKPKSTTLKAKSLIRGEIKHRYSPSATGYGRSTVTNMKQDAESGWGRYRGYGGDYHKGANLVDSGNFRCYYDDQAKFLSKIYGKKNVDKWSGQKIHNTYKHLIGREYASMVRESQKTKPKKKTKRR